MRITDEALGWTLLLVTFGAAYCWATWLFGAWELAVSLGMVVLVAGVIVGGGLLLWG